MSERFTLEQLEPSAPPPLETPEGIVAAARAGAVQIHEQAQADGYRQGFEAGMQAGAEEVRSAVQALAASLGEVERSREELAQAQEEDAVELALDLAGKIVAGTIELEPERVVDVVRGALRRLGERRRITVLVDPGDLQIVSAAVEELRTQVGGIEVCEVQSDRRVGRGGAIVRTSESEIDVRVQTQLEQARELALAGRPAPEPAS